MNEFIFYTEKNPNYLIKKNQIWIIFSNKNSIHTFLINGKNLNLFLVELKSFRIKIIQRTKHYPIWIII